MNLVALPVVLLLVLCVLGLGSLLADRLCGEADGPTAQAAASLSLGLLAASVGVLILGHFALLRSFAILALLAAGASVAVVRRRRLLQLVRQLAADLRPESWFDRSAATVVAVLGLLEVISTIRIPSAIDEIEYHWASPLFWAAQHGWVDSPHKLSDSFSLTEILYTAPATVGGYVVAHATHLLFFVVLLLSVASLARAVDAPIWLAIAAVATMPVIANQAPIAYNDVALAAYCLAAIALLVAGPRTRRRLFLVGLLASAAISTKSLGIVIVPVLVSVLVMSGRRSAESLRALVRQVIAICLPVIGVIAFWLVRSIAVTGHAFDSEGIHIVSTSHPFWATGQATGRVPDLAGIAALPFVPFITGIIGQQEPYGGRTGLTVLGLLLALLLGTALNPRSLWRDSRLLLVPGIVWFALMTPVLLKTRFNMTGFVLLAVAGCVAYRDLLPRLSARIQTLVSLAAVASMVLSATDVSHVILRGPWVD